MQEVRGLEQELWGLEQELWGPEQEQEKLELYLPASSSKVFSYKRNNDTHFPSMRRH